MACKKPNCCRKAKAVETKMTMRATAECKETVEKDLDQEDKSLAELIEKEEKDEDKD